MKIILSLLTILIIGITIYYILKKRKENFEVKGDKQPEVSEEIYDYNLEQALKIWEDIIGPGANGSYKPTRRNRRIWAHESWREELKAYVKEADKYNREHNWFDYVPGRGKTLIIKRRDVTREKVSPIGIRKAWRRIYGEDLGKYRFPKMGDRVRILLDDNQKKENTKYYTGVVLATYGFGSNRITRVLWDRLKNPSGGRDIKRWKSKGVRPIVRDKRVISTGILFGWPYWPWRRHFSDHKIYDYVKPLSWVSQKDLGRGLHFFNGKYLYKVVECKPKGTTGCDYLRCDKRTEAALTDYPITYYCGVDVRNRHPGIWKCDSGSNKGKFYNYYNKLTMCREDYKRGKKDTFCVQDCRGRCVPTYLNKEINKAKNRSNSKCAYLVSDHPNRIEDGTYVILDSDKAYNYRTGGVNVTHNSLLFTGWRKYANESSYKHAPRPGQTYMYRWKTYYAGNWFERNILRNKRRRKKVPYVLVRYGKGRRWWIGWLKVGQWHRCSHIGWHRAFWWDPYRGRYKECQYYDKRRTRIRIPNQKSRIKDYNPWWYRNNAPSELRHLKNKKIRSMKVFGRNCKFATKNRYYGPGFHRNLSLTGGKTTCSLGRKAAVYQGCGYHYQNYNDCRRECGGSCYPKVVRLRRHGCTYSRGNRVGGRPLIPF